MAEPFLSEIRIFSFGFAPKGWAVCDGQLMPINQNQALFSLLGTTYGGDGRVNFALPNLRGRAQIHEGAGHTLGETGGSTSVTLAQSQMPTHTHLPSAKTIVGNANAPSANVVLASAVAVQADSSTVPVSMYSTNAPTDLLLSPGAISNVGGSQPHNNMMPYLTLNFCIALQGIFPSQN